MAERAIDAFDGQTVDQIIEHYVQHDPRCREEFRTVNERGICDECHYGEVVALLRRALDAGTPSVRGGEVTDAEVVCALVEFAPKDHGGFATFPEKQKEHWRVDMRRVLEQFAASRGTPGPRQRFSTDATPWLVRIEGPCVEPVAEAATLAEAANIVGLGAPGAGAADATWWEAETRRILAALTHEGTDVVERVTRRALEARPDDAGPPSTGEGASPVKSALLPEAINSGSAPTPSDAGTSSTGRAASSAEVVLTHVVDPHERGGRFGEDVLSVKCRFCATVWTDEAEFSSKKIGDQACPARAASGQGAT